MLNKRDITYFNEDVTPVVTIAILSKDSPELIMDCITSIQRKVEYNNYKILLGDTGTTCVKTLKYYDYLKKKYSNVKIVDCGEYNFSVNYNYLIETFVDTPYTLILNNDTVAQNDFVTEMMRYIQNNKIAAVGARLDYPDGKIQHAGQVLYDKRGHLCGPGHLMLGQDSNTELNNHLVDGVTAACMLVKTWVFKEVGGFDVIFTDAYQDVDINLKFRKNGYSIYQCNSAKLTHIDNASRKLLWGADITNKLKDDMYRYLEKWKNSYPKPISKSPKTIFSFVTMVTDRKQYETVLKSINYEAYEIIFTRNDIAKYTAPEALNNLQLISEGTYTVFCHQDIEFGNTWCYDVLKNIHVLNKLNNSSKQWGVLGFAGFTSTGNGHSFLHNNVINNTELKNTKDIIDVQTVDEMCFITRNKFMLFDEYIDGFHFYGADYCISSNKYGCRNYIINAPIRHYSLDGTKNLKTDNQWNEFKRLAKKLATKWNTAIHTTSVRIDKNEIEYMLANKLNRTRIEYHK